VDQYIKEGVQNMSRKGSKGGGGKQMGGAPPSVRFAAKKMKVNKDTLSREVKYLLSNFTEDEIVEIFK